MKGVKRSWRESKKKKESKPITQTSVVLIGKSSFTSFSVCVATSSGLLFAPSFILMGAPALKYHNVVAGKPSTGAVRPTMCEYSCHIWWQIWLFAPFHTTGCGSAGVNASTVDKKLSVSHSVPRWAMAVAPPLPSFSPAPLYEDLSLQNTFQVRVWNWFWSFQCCQLQGIVQQWSRPTAAATAHIPPTFTDLLSAEWDSKKKKKKKKKPQSTKCQNKAFLKLISFW